jgi:hypothetical protein
MGPTELSQISLPICSNAQGILQSMTMTRVRKRRRLQEMQKSFLRQVAFRTPGRFLEFR